VGRFDQLGAALISTTSAVVGGRIESIWEGERPMWLHGSGLGFSSSRGWVCRIVKLNFLRTSSLALRCAQKFGVSKRQTNEQITFAQGSFPFSSGQFATIIILYYLLCRADRLNLLRKSVLDIYVINLDKDVQRLHWMEQQLTAHKLEYLRIAAVNGAQIRARHDLVDPRRSHLGAAEIGCLLSHANAWRLIAQADDEHGLVLEDDIHVSDDFGDLLRSMSLDPKEFCVHKMETLRANVTLTRQPTYTARNRRPHKLETNHGGSGAYIINKGTASRLLNYIDLLREAIDTELFDPERRNINNLTIYQWVPAPCIQDFLVGESKCEKSFVSNIGVDRSDLRFYSVNDRKKYEEFFKFWLRPLYTKLYSARLFQSGRMRRRIEFG
jgi:glycosyl transferase family 25